MNSAIKKEVFWLVIVISAFLLWESVKSSLNGPKIPEISYSEFLSEVEAGNVSKVIIFRNRIDVLQANGPAPSGENTKSKQLEYDALGRLTSV